MNVLRATAAIAIILLIYAFWFSIGILGIVGGLLALEIPGAQIIGLVVTFGGFLLTLRFVGRLFRLVAKQPELKARKS